MKNEGSLPRGVWRHLDREIWVLVLRGSDGEMTRSARRRGQCRLSLLLFDFLGAALKECTPPLRRSPSPFSKPRN